MSHELKVAKYVKTSVNLILLGIIGSRGITGIYNTLNPDMCRTDMICEQDNNTLTVTTTDFFNPGMLCARIEDSDLDACSNSLGKLGYGSPDNSESVQFKVDSNGNLLNNFGSNFSPVSLTVKEFTSKIDSTSRGAKADAIFKTENTLSNIGTVLAALGLLFNNLYFNRKIKSIEKKGPKKPPLVELNPDELENLKNVLGVQFLDDLYGRLDSDKKD